MQHVPWNRTSEGEEIEYSNSKLLDIINEYVHSERDRLILKRRYIDDIHFEPLAEESKLSVRQVKYIAKKYEPMLLSKMTKD